MGKLIVLSLDESEKGLYDKILEIVNEADISIDRKLDESQSNIHIGGLSIMPRQYKVIKQGDQYRIPYSLCSGTSSRDNAFQRKNL